MRTKSIFFLLLTVLFTGYIFTTTAAEAKDIDQINSATKEVLSESENEDAFNTMMKVLTHPRCMNCHPNDKIPKQGMDSHLHYFDMAAGESIHGFQALNCDTCHKQENNDFSGVPGAPDWALAPPSMAWEGLDKYEIAAVILDRSKNGNRNLAVTEHHLTEHKLVLWGWDPGVDANGVPREPVPVPLEEYRAAVHTWIENGAVIPERK